MVGRTVHGAMKELMGDEGGYMMKIIHTESSGQGSQFPNGKHVSL
jgi:hypothetical protein